MGIEEGRFEKIALDKIDRDPEKNVRKAQLTEDLGTLKESIRLEGFLQPITVAPKEGGRYELIIGQRRYLAAQELNLETIPAIVLKEPVDRITGLRMSIEENIHRRNPVDDDIIAACKILHDTYGKAETVAEKLGISKKDADMYCVFHDATEGLKALVRAKKIPKDTAVAIVRDSYDAKGKVDEKRVEELTELATGGMLTKEEQKRIPDVLDETPKASVNEVEKKAKEPSKDYILRRIVLPRKEGDRLEEATKKRGDPKPIDTARIAIVDWLDLKGY